MTRKHCVTIDGAEMTVRQYGTSTRVELDEMSVQEALGLESLESGKYLVNVTFELNEIEKNTKVKSSFINNKEEESDNE